MYKEDSYFIEQVNRNNIIGIKSSIESMIQIFYGDKQEIDKAIEYAIKNSSFDWEEHKEYKLYVELENKRMEYNYEKGKLVQNFSKERYEKVLRLFKDIMPERDKENIQKNNISESSSYKTSKSSGEKIVKKEQKKPFEIVEKGFEIVEKGFEVMKKGFEKVGFKTNYVDVPTPKEKYESEEKFYNHKIK